VLTPAVARVGGDVEEQCIRTPHKVEEVLMVGRWGQKAGQEGKTKDQQNVAVTRREIYSGSAWVGCLLRKT